MNVAIDTDTSQASGYYSQIDLDDLHAPDPTDGIALNLQNAKGFMDGLGDTQGNDKQSDAAVDNVLAFHHITRSARLILFPD